MRLIARWTVQYIGFDGKQVETVWEVFDNGKEAIISSPQPEHYVGRYLIGEWQTRLETLATFYMRGTVIKREQY